MEKVRIHAYTLLGFSLVISLVVAAMISCGGSTTPTTATTGTVNISMTDPATCGSSFPHVYVTVTKVTANINGDAGPNDSGWQTLIDLTSSPVQVDLMSLANATTVCLLKSLGASGPLPPGKYQQIRLYLLSNTASGAGTPTSNACMNNTGWNCVDTGSGFVELQLPSEVQTGIKIPSPNIVSGGLTVTAGQSVDLNIDFKSCESIVREGNGMFRLKPVLFAGEVTQNMNSISGQVVLGDSSGQPVLTSGNPTPIAGATVLFEQASGGTESIVDSTTTDSNGNFFVCPLPGTGNFDIVVTAQTTGNSGTTTYNPTVSFSVPMGTRLSQIPLVPETVSMVATTGGAAAIAGQVDTAPTTTNGEDVTLTPTMLINSTNVIIPVFGVNGSTATAQPPSVTTTSTPTPSTPACATGSDCFNFSVTVPASNPNFGTFNNGSITYGGPASGSITYGLTAATPGCTSGTPAGTANASSIVVTPDNTTTIPNTPTNPLALSGCS
jgi:Domain of unknown function (DUF4382)